MTKKMFNQKISYGLAVLSGILLLFSLPPFKFGGVLAWFAFVPFLIAIFYENDIKRTGKLAKIFGLFSLPLFIWLSWWIPDLFSSAHLEHLFWLWFILGLGLGIAMATDFYGDTINNYWKPKHLPSKGLSYLPPSLQVIILPLVYTAGYFLAMNVPGIMRIGSAFGFFSLAKTQWLNPAVMQLASFTGMYGVTFLILSVNCAIAYGIIHYKETKKAYKPTIVILAIFLVVLVFGFIEVPNNIEKGDVTVAVIQTSPEEGQDINDLYLRLSEESLKYNPKILVWPSMMMEGLSPPTNFSIDHNVYLVSAEVISPEGTTVSDNLGYHMVTLFENFKDKDIKSVFFPKVYSLNTDLGNFGIANCMESGSALPTRKRVRDGAQVLIVPTGCPNTYVLSWVLGTSAIYRAVEHRMFAVEVIGDHDSSIIIDPYGRIIEDMAPEPEIVVGKISFTDERTFYTKYGDVFGWTITGLYIVLIIYNFYLKKKSPFKYCKYCRTRIAKEVKICPKCGKKTK